MFALRARHSDRPRVSVGVTLDDVKKLEDQNDDQAKDSQPSERFQVDPPSATESHEFAGSI
jgi:hypothetical protein